jgi:hypothetical protein
VETHELNKEGMTDGFVITNSIDASNRYIVFHCLQGKILVKKTLLAVALLSSSAVASSAFAADGAVNFTGTITDAACTVDTASQNQNVFLGNIARTAFPVAGSLAAAKKFTLVLTNCPDTVTGATVRLTAPRFLAITHSGTDRR